MFIEMWHQRAKDFQRRILRYSRYVLNDHLAILLFLGMGVFFMAYANWLRTVTSLSLIQSSFLGLLIWAVSHLGTIHTYIEEADLFFLAPAHGKMLPYLKQAIKGSIPVSIIYLGLLLLVVSPLMGASHEHPWLSLVSLGLLCLIYKGGMWTITWARWTRLGFATWVKLLYELIFIGIFMSFAYLGPGQVGLLVLGGGICGLVWIYVKKLPGFFHWNLIYQDESTRQTRIYQAINWFVDVKELKAQSNKPQTYLDGLIPLLQGKSPSPYRFYLVRKLIRQGGLIQAFLISMGLGLLGPMMDLDPFWLVAWMVFAQFSLSLTLFSLTKIRKTRTSWLPDWTEGKGSDWIKTCLPILLGQGLVLVLAFVLMGWAGQTGWLLLAMGINLGLTYLLLVQRVK